MRFLRNVVIGVIALAAAAILPPATATAVPPSPPYTAFILEGTGSVFPGIRSFDNTTATTLVTGYSNYGFEVFVYTPNFMSTYSIVFHAPATNPIVVGTTYPTLWSGQDSTHGFMSVQGEGRGCNHQSGFITIYELVYGTGSGNITSLAFRYTTSCDSDTQLIFGELRFNSSIGMAATTPGPSSLDFGEQQANAQGDEHTVTITASGYADSVLGAARIVDGSSFVVTGDTCSDTTVVAGGTCAIRVRAEITALGTQTARLRLPVNSGRGEVSVPLTAVGVDRRQLAVLPPSLDFGTVTVDQTAAVMSTTLTASGTEPVSIGSVTLGGSAPQAFLITENPCSSVALQPGQSCTIKAVARPTSAGLQTASIIIPTNNAASPTLVMLRVRAEQNNDGTYYPLTPSRLLDTREGNGAPRAPVGPGGTIHLQVAGRGGVPVSGVSAVVLNVTVTGPTAAGHITVWPTGVAMPTASSLNFVAGWTGANSVTVAVGAGGQVDLFNSQGNTHLIADVVGYYAKDNSIVPAKGFGGEFQPVTPERLFDSRFDWGVKLPAGASLKLPVSYGSSFDPHIRALAVNVTAVNGQGNGYLTTFTAQGLPPLASTLNFTHDSTVSSFAIVPTGRCTTCGQGVFPIIGVYTSMDVDVIVDIIGFYDDGQLADGIHDGLRFIPRTPMRITDTRTGLGSSGPLGAGATVWLNAPVAALPPATEALALNVTAVAPTANTFISVWPAGMPQPSISTLNPGAGQIVPNATPVLLGDSDSFNVYNNGGSTHLVIDMVGSFYFRPALTGAATPQHASGLRTTKVQAQMYRN